MLLLLYLSRARTLEVIHLADNVSSYLVVPIDVVIALACELIKSRPLDIPRQLLLAFVFR